MASSRYPSDAERVSVSYSNPGGPVRHARFTLTSAVTVPRVVRRSGAAIGGDSRGERYYPYFFALSPCALNSKKKLHENNQRHFHPYPNPRRVGDRLSASVGCATIWRLSFHFVRWCGLRSGTRHLFHLLPRVRVTDHLLALVLASVGAYTIAFAGPFPIFFM
jgi:hypothetical protein